MNQLEKTTRSLTATAEVIDETELVERQSHYVHCVLPYVPEGESGEGWE